MSNQNLSAFIWSVADLLRGDFKQSDYGKVILPFTILRRLDCTLVARKVAALSEHYYRVAQGLDSAQFLRTDIGTYLSSISASDVPILFANPINLIITCGFDECATALQSNSQELTHFEDHLGQDELND